MIERGHIFHAAALLAAAAVAAAALAGCSGQADSAASAPGPSAALDTTAAAASTPTAAVAADAAGAGWGALQAAWGARHTPDTRFAAGSAFDPDPALADREEGAQYTSTYFAVTVQNGRVLAYSIRFRPGTPLPQAQTRALAEFPPDAHVDWAVTSPTCHTIQVSSAKLRKGGVTRQVARISFFSADPAAFNARAVREAILDEFEPTRGPDEGSRC